MEEVCDVCGSEMKRCTVSKTSYGWYYYCHKILIGVSVESKRRRTTCIYCERKLKVIKHEI